MGSLQIELGPLLGRPSCGEARPDLNEVASVGALLDRFDTSIAVSVYAVVMLIVTIICVLLAPETSKIDLHADPANQPTGAR